LYNYDDFFDNLTYYEGYHTELIDDYYRAYMLDFAEVEPWGFNYTNTYDVAANYCSEVDGVTIVDTTYDNYGYSGYFRLNGREIAIDSAEDVSSDLFALDNGYVFHEDGFGELKVELIRVDDTTIKAKYTLKNLTGLATDYGVAFYSDIEFGDNDDAAISKTNHSFKITQDYSGEASTYGAQFNIDLDPLPTTTFVGDFTDAEDDRWKNSPKDYYTAADSVDTGLSYSWQGRIGANESKTFTATFNIGAVTPFENRFYFLSDGYTTPSTSNAIDGGALTLPIADRASAPGKHHVWNTAADGSGAQYESSATIIADKNHTDYYEIEVPNQAITVPMDGYDAEEFILVIDEEFKAKHQELADSVYSDVGFIPMFYEIDPENAETHFESEISKEQIEDVIDEEFVVHDNLFSFDGMLVVYDDGEETQILPMDESKYPFTIKIKLSEEFVSGKSDFQMVRISKSNEENEQYDIYELAPTTYNPGTGELFLTISEAGEFYYSLAYINTPGVPSTGFATLQKQVDMSLAIIATFAFVTFSIWYGISRAKAKNKIYKW